MVLGMEPKHKGMFMDYKKAVEITEEYAKKYNLHVDPNAHDSQAVCDLLDFMQFMRNKDQAQPTDVVLHVRDLEYTNEWNKKMLKKLSFDVRKGEILGIAGVEGNGQYRCGGYIDRKSVV